MQEERLALDLPRMGNVQPVVWITHEGLVRYRGPVLFKLLLKPDRRGAYCNEGAEKPMGMSPDHTKRAMRNKASAGRSGMAESWRARSARLLRSPWVK